MAYTTDLWDGVLNLHALANYTDEHTSVNASGQVTDNAGSMSNVTGGSGQPKFKATLAATYDFGPYSGTVQTRLLSSGRLLNTWTSLDVDDNTVPGVAYLDLRGSYNINDNWQAFFAVDNTLDTPPPSAPGPYNSASSYYTPASPGTVYDLFGRMYRVGLRVNF
jgi:outer membrane receptor protein involved in Fe transport